ncbi:MAG: BolA family protein [Halothiobacillaceae bacterium]
MARLRLVIGQNAHQHVEAHMSTEARIRETLQARFAPERLELQNESHMHAGGAGRESHFRCVLVAEGFDGQSLLERHRAVHAALGDLMGRIHAFSVHAYTPAEWLQRAQQAPASPPCASSH